MRIFRQILAILENQSQKNLKHFLTCCRWLCHCFGEFFLEKQEICDKKIPSQKHFSQNGQNLHPKKNHYSNFQAVSVYI